MLTCRVGKISSFHSNTPRTASCHICQEDHEARDSCNMILKGGGHANFDAEFFVPMDSLGDA